MGPYAGDDYNLTLCRLQSRLQDSTMRNPKPKSTLPYARVELSLSQVLRILPLYFEHPQPWLTKMLKHDSAVYQTM
jgi:hypothetical protein